MIVYILRRVAVMIATATALSIVVFAIIQLPPGDYLTSYLAQLSLSGERMSAADIEALRARYGLDLPFFSQYWIWFSGLLQGDFGYSFELKRPVSDIFMSRIGMSLVVEMLAIVVMWGIAIPVAIYSAVRQYSVGDYLSTIFAFIGLAVPNFLFALVLMYLAYVYFGATISGLFSPEYINARWSLDKLVDFAAHVWAPVLVIATGGAAQVLRVLRANLLDELYKPYVTTARAKGLEERKLLMRYPVRVAMNPLISTVGWILPTVISSSIVTAIVLNLPTLAPVLLTSLQSQDMYLAGALIMFMGMLTLIGTLVSDILLAWVDPRVRMGMVGSK